MARTKIIAALLLMPGGAILMGSNVPPDLLATMMDAAARARKAGQAEFDSFVAGIDPAKLTLSP